jgi:hypothetical protein
MLAFGYTGCSSLQSEPKQTMTPSDQVPAGQGTVQATKTDNGNTELQIEVKHLAPPSRLAPDASTYVVWIKPHNAPMQNVGALEVDDDLVGKLTTTTPHKASRLTVTPEASPQATSPSHDPVFESDVNRTD